mgnify:CR=1 FL=1
MTEVGQQQVLVGGLQVYLVFDPENFQQDGVAGLVELLRVGDFQYLVELYLVFNEFFCD